MTAESEDRSSHYTTPSKLHVSRGEEDIAMDDRIVVTTVIWNRAHFPKHTRCRTLIANLLHNVLCLSAPLHCSLILDLVHGALQFFAEPS